MPASHDAMLGPRHAQIKPASPSTRMGAPVLHTWRLFDEANRVDVDAWVYP